MSRIKNISYLVWSFMAVFLSVSLGAFASVTTLPAKDLEHFELSKNGKVVFVQGLDPNTGRPGHYILDLLSRRTTSIPVPDGEEIILGGIDHSGRYIIFQTEDGRGRDSVFLWDAVTRRMLTLARRISWDCSWRYSKDGRHIFVFAAGLYAIDLAKWTSTAITDSTVNPTWDVSHTVFDRLESNQLNFNYEVPGPLGREIHNVQFEPGKGIVFDYKFSTLCYAGQHVSLYVSKNFTGYYNCGTGTANYRSFVVDLHWKQEKEIPNLSGARFFVGDQTLVLQNAQGGYTAHDVLSSNEIDLLPSRGRKFAGEYFLYAKSQEIAFVEVGQHSHTFPSALRLFSTRDFVPTRTLDLSHAPAGLYDWYFSDDGEEFTMVAVNQSSRRAQVHKLNIATGVLRAGEEFSGLARPPMFSRACQHSDDNKTMVCYDSVNGGILNLIDL